MSSRVIKITVKQLDVEPDGAVTGEELLVEGTITPLEPAITYAVDDEAMDLWRCSAGLCDCAEHADHII